MLNKGHIYPSGQDQLSAELPAASATDALRRRALMDGVVVSLHEHPVRLPSPLTSETWRAHISSKADVLAVEELLNSDLSFVVANCFSIPEWDYVSAWAASLRASVDAAAGLSLALRKTDVPITAHEGGIHTKVMLGLEDLGSIGKDLGLLDDLFETGVRMAGVAYNTGSALGSGLAETSDDGLTSFGRSAVAAMNRCGMVVDVSHAGDRTAIDVANSSTSPVVISHAGARGLFPSRRMKPDDVIRAVVEHGGVIGIEAAPGSTRVDILRTDHHIDDIIKHVEYCSELVGIDGVAIGGDTFYGDHVGIYRATESRAFVPEGVPDFDGCMVTGAENPTEMPLQICAALIQLGWSDADIGKILGVNAQRVLRASLPD